MRVLVYLKLQVGVALVMIMLMLLLLSYGLVLSSVAGVNSVFAQQTTDNAGVTITSPKQGQEVPVGKLTISGTSTDNPTTDCQVFADVNDIKPLQNATATGPGGVSDYSTWQFTYTEDYQLIKEGVNELTSKLTCISNPPNMTKYYSVNVTGISATQSGGNDIAPSLIPTPSGYFDDEEKIASKTSEILQM
jgi:hypothetical protein